jgi:hypothetical protein
MKKIRTVFCVLLCLAILAGALSVGAFAAEPRDTSFYEGLASDLKALRLFRGVSDTDFDLNRAPTRVEALVMLVRILGKEDEALNGEWSHPFTDVPEWAGSYVGYAYQTGLTNGSSATEFGTGPASAAMYLTFILRALGYSDAGGEDFTWDNPFILAYYVGILPGCVDVDAFLRADVVSVSYAALDGVYLKDGSTSLAGKLVASGVFTQGEYDAVFRPGIFTDYAEANGYSVMKYEWDALGTTWQYELWIPLEAVEYYKQIPRDPYSILSGYTSYVYDTEDDEFISSIARTFAEAAARDGYSDDEAVLLAVRFVQSLAYLPDDDALEYDYPKYPLETLYDLGGDCEDSSILLVSLLREMGYGCCLVEFYDHMGVGVLGDDYLDGWYYTYNGLK